QKNEGVKDQKSEVKKIKRAKVKKGQESEGEKCQESENAKGQKGEGEDVQKSEDIKGQKRESEEGQKNKPIPPGVFKNASLFSALTFDDLLEFTQKTSLNCFNLKTFIMFIITKSSSYLKLSPENTLYWFKEVVYQIFSKNIAIKYYENAEREVNDFKTKQAESKHFGFWYLVGKWNFKKIAKEEFASSPHHSINVRKRIQESEYRLRFAKRVKASLKPNNEFNKFIEAVIRFDLEQLPENKPLRSWHINTDAIPPIEISEKTWLTDTVHQFLEAAVHNIPGLICATLSRHLGNEENRKPDRTVRLKLEDNQFEILYIEGANPELKGKSIKKTQKNSSS
ncbi:4844_t:CDS:2, partial [Racocetra persica]